MRITLLFLSLFLSATAYSQIRVRNTDLKNSDSAILFRDLKNHFEVTGIKDMSQYLVYWQGAYMTRIGDQKLLVTNIIKDTVTVKVNYIGKGKSVVVYTRKFLAQDAGRPTVVLNEEQDDTLSFGHVWNGTSLEVKVPNTNYGGDWNVAHFEISLNDPAGHQLLPPTFISGKYLTKAIYDQIKELPSGSNIKFKQVILTYTDGGYQQYKDFELQRK